jgi:hypothetical protein
VSARIVRMFEFYSHNIDPDDAVFQSYIKEYVSTRDSRSPNAIPYSDLYKMIKQGIREYIQKTRREQNEDQKNET